VSCLPGNIPGHINIDVSPLKIGDNLKIGDLPKDDRYRVISDPHLILAVCAPPAKEEVAAPVATEAVAAAPAEPEVIKKGKTVDEAAGEGAEPDEGKKKEAKKPEGREGKK